MMMLVAEPTSKNSTSHKLRVPITAKNFRLNPHRGAATPRQLLLFSIYVHTNQQHASNWKEASVVRRKSLTVYHPNPHNDRQGITHMRLCPLAVVFDLLAYSH
jgi:hypothetical protein